MKFVTHLHVLNFIQHWKTCPACGKYAMHIIYPACLHQFVENTTVLRSGIIFLIITKTIVMKLQSFINGMIVGVVIGIISASVSKGELGKRVSDLRDSLREAHDSAEDDVLEKLIELKSEEEEVMERFIQ
jgi:hypothetical protein